MPTAREIRIGLLLALIFIAGGVCGALWMRHLGGGPTPRLRVESVEETRQRLLGEIMRELRLTPEQMNRIGPITEEWGREAASLGRGRFAQKLVLADRMAAGVRTNLTAEQLPIFERRLQPIRRRLERLSEP